MQIEIPVSMLFLRRAWRLPRRCSAMRKNVTIGFSEDEILRLQGAAAMARRPLATYLRSLHHASGKPLVPGGLRSVLQDLCKQGACIGIQYRRGLTAPVEVRMVRWGFRALKTPERASYSPTLQRRLRLECKPSAKPTQTQTRPSAVQRHLLDKTWTDSVRNECSLERNAERSENFHREA